jgi:hypothetical protein
VKKLVPLLLAAMLWAGACPAAENAPPAKDPLIGVVLHKKLSYEYDRAKNAARLVGIGPVKLESGNVEGDVKVTMRFSFPKNEIVRYCIDELGKEQVSQTQYNLWGYGRSKISQEGGHPAVTVTFSRLIHCENVAYLTDTPIMGPLFQDGTIGTGAGVPVPPPPPPDLLTPEDYKIVAQAREAEIGPEDISRMPTPMVQQLHAVAADGKMAKAQKMAALKGILTAELSSQDFSILEDWGYKRPLVAALPPLDRAKLHFIIGDTSIPDAMKQQEVQTFVSALPAPWLPPYPAQSQSAPPAPPVEEPSLITRFVPVWAVIGAIALFELGWRLNVRAKKGRAPRRGLLVALYAAIVFVVAILLFNNARTSYFCGINPASLVRPSVKYCVEDLLNVRPANDPPTYPGCQPGEGDMDHPFCFR